MRLFYDERDHRYALERGDQRLYWLDDLGAVPIAECGASERGFVFAGARPMEDYQRLVDGLPGVRDHPEEREPLLRLDVVLNTLARAGVEVPMPRTWVLPLDAPTPPDLPFPLFVRTVESSWKLGGAISKVKNPTQLAEEAEALRRGIRWDATILAREWLDLATAGESSYGPVPQEIRVWVVDRSPVAWSFHHLHAVPKPTGFPPSTSDLRVVRDLAKRVANPFGARLVVVDVARLQTGAWVFIEAGPGSCAGTAHETVFKAVAGHLLGQPTELRSDPCGGPLAE